MDKKELRKELKAKRSNLSSVFIHEASAVIQAKCLKWVTDYNHIGIYVADAYEVNTHALISQLLKAGKYVYVPKIMDDMNMEFYQISNFNELEKGRYNILEPVSKISVDPMKMECMIIPLVAYNEQKYRIGQGKGYYDRYLARCNCFKIGLAYAFQKTAFIADEYDIPCDLIINEE